MRRQRGESGDTPPIPLWPRGGGGGKGRRESRPPKPHSKARGVLDRFVSIRALLIASVVLLVVIAAAISWVTQHYLAKSGIDDLSSSIRTLVRIGVNYQLTSILEGAKAISSIDNGTFTYAITNVSQAMRTVYWKHIYRLIQAAPTIGSMVYGNVVGDAVGVRKVISFEDYTAPTTSRYLYFYTNGSDPNSQLINYNVEPISINPTNISYVTDFDLFSRPWYLAGLSSPDGSYVWSPVFLNSELVLTMSLAQPFFDANDTLIGVLGLHLYLPSIKAALYTLNDGGNMVLIVDDAGFLVMDSCSVNLGILATCPGVFRDPRAIHPLAASGGLLAKIDGRVKSDYGGYSSIPAGDTFTIGGDWVSFDRIYDRNLVWIAISVIHIDDYLHKVSQADKWTLIAAALFTFVAAVLAFVTSIAVTRPISRSISQMDLISKMEFGGKSKTVKQRRSYLYEINAMQKSLSRLRTALSSFEKFVPNNVIKEILSQDIEAHLGVTPWFATVYFCDIEDFTTIAEALDPTKLVELLLDFLQEMSNIILEETSGTIDKFIGDAIMAFWNAPHPVERHAEMACLAALRCQHKIAQDLRPKWALQGLPEGLQLNARIGIHTGEVLIGNIGSLERINYTAIGDNVNIASRLEALCKFYHARIIISSTTYEQVKANFVCRLLDRVVVKGKSQALMLYELVAERTYALPEQIQMCIAVENAANLVFFNPDQEQGLAAYEALLRDHPEDVCIARVRERLHQLMGTEQWPGMEVFDHK